MAGRAWLIDSNRFATKIMSASGSSDPRQVVWKSNPTKNCPNCDHVIDNSDVVDDWPGLPRGVKFDPSDPEIIWHLLAKSGLSGLSPHPFINEFIPTVSEDDGICYTHPKNLPGVKHDGSVSHFFHKAIKAYSTGTRKRRKIHDDDLGDVRWHKTGRTKPVVLDGVQRGCKKIMVLYGGKAVKTNWVMHQYHLGIEEDEKEGDYVVSKIFYQQPVVKQGDKPEQEVSEDIFAAMTPKADPVTPKLVTPEPRHTVRLSSDSHLANDYVTTREVSPHDYLTAQEVALAETTEAMYMEEEVQGIEATYVDEHEPQIGIENRETEMIDDKEEKEKDENQAEEDPTWLDSGSQFVLDSQQLVEATYVDEHEPQIGIENRETEMIDNKEEKEKDENQAEEDPTWLDSGSQFVLDSQQLVEALSLCDDFLLMGSQDREENTNNGGSKNKQPCFADYAHLGPEDFKRDLEECQKIGLDPSNIELDTPPEFRLSQLEFGSQESFLAWGTGKTD